MPLLLAVAVIGSSCEDALGPDNGSRDQMKAVRSDRGSPDQVLSELDAVGYFESWTYFPSGSAPGASYLFRWGGSFETCAVEGPAEFDVIPVMAKSAVSSLPDAPAQAFRPATDRVG
jgi:hypothetical protein